ncbi:MAG: DUF5721 family protein [Defluviitaleaceae bacterium]|nr:DUF5721 family protein [Defluviitaleaceae bacterium]
MLAMELDTAAVKPFMASLLREDLFDKFETRSVEVVGKSRISIENNAEGGYIPWGELRPLVHTIVKAGGKPRYVKVVLSFPGEKTSVVHGNAAALFLNLVYENDGVTFTTATAQREFQLEKTLDQAWDTWVAGFFARKGLEVKSRE